MLGLHQSSNCMAQAFFGLKKCRLVPPLGKKPKGKDKEVAEIVSRITINKSVATAASASPAVSLLGGQKTNFPKRTTLSFMRGIMTKVPLGKHPT